MDRLLFLNSFTSTLTDSVALLAFLSGNALLTALTWCSHLATAAVVNLVPLYLGARTNLLLDFLDIPPHIHQLAHSWLGFIFVL